MAEQAFHWLHWSRQQARVLLCIDVGDQTSQPLTNLLFSQLNGYFSRQDKAFRANCSLTPPKVNTAIYQDSASAQGLNPISQVNAQAQRGISAFMPFEASQAPKALAQDVATTKADTDQFAGQTNSLFSTCSLTGQQYRSQLGRENRLVLIDMRRSFNPDVIAALGGTVIGGGVMVILVKQPKTLSFTLAHFSQGFGGRRHCHYLKLSGANLQQGDKDTITDVFSVPECINKRQIHSDKHSAQYVNNSIAKQPEDGALSHFDNGAVNEQQHQAITKIIKVATGRRDRPLVITADRGRGKTTALALASMQLLQESTTPITIFITAPSPMSIQTYFRHFQQNTNEFLVHGLHVKYRQHHIRFVPVDELIAGDLQCQLLLIDEAAGIPITLLKRLSTCYHRVVFSSTVHGYEGAGRGFTHKFLPHLHRIYANSRELHLSRPVRWSQHDELEQLLFERFFLNASLATLPDNIKSTKAETVAAPIRYQWLQGKELIQCPQLFEQVFALLVGAHYQTKPSDLKVLLDDEQVYLGLQLVGVSAELPNQPQADSILTGVAMLMFEGDLDEELIAKINQGQRRISGQFTPQSLLTQANVEWAFNFRYARVLRIAVHPELQSQGYGKLLLSAAEIFAIDQRLDCLSTSFGGNQQLFHFWQDSEFQVARLGFTRDKASGEHSILMLKPLTAEAKPRVFALQLRWRRELISYLPDEYQNLSPCLVALLLSATGRCTLEDDGQQLSPFSADDLIIVEHFIDGSRQLSCCIPALQRLLMSLTKTDYSYVKNTALNELGETSSLAVLVAKILQKHSFSLLAKRFDLTGQKAVIKQLQVASEALLQRIKANDQIHCHSGENSTSKSRDMLDNT
ncbi:tRNA(Met) cytidine acetyltransferase [Thalassotalea litorea]|uniref:tRNA(Met) cytidine acetyltransferase n=1 Tax=Thalassotalea litorea TaxID=2020715 RepID=A0A5R9IQV8_9GAMM|nr:GNAT family N-acetyltransferase [Thalassotalea litorea]TLU66863.1 tRNA(Met) cytidine acetyltransferase [Thalassotalea litorea]